MSVFFLIFSFFSR